MSEVVLFLNLFNDRQDEFGVLVYLSECSKEVQVELRLRHAEQGVDALVDSLRDFSRDVPPQEEPLARDDLPVIHEDLDRSEEGRAVLLDDRGSHLYFGERFASDLLLLPTQKHLELRTDSSLPLASVGLQARA